jgi:hypothetical protein
LSALNKNNIKIARLLLDRGACPNATLHCNKLSRTESLLDHFIGSGGNEGAKLLYLYGAQSHKQKITSWVPTFRNPFGSTSEINLTSINHAKALFETDPEDVLAYCAMFDEPNLGETLRRVLKPNCDDCCVDKKRLALAYAAGRALPGVVEVLLQAGADPAPAFHVVNGILLRPCCRDNRDTYLAIYQSLRAPVIKNTLSILHQDTKSYFNRVPQEIIDDIHAFSTKSVNNIDPSISYATSTFHITSNQLERVGKEKIYSSDFNTFTYVLLALLILQGFKPKTN